MRAKRGKDGRFYRTCQDLHGRVRFTHRECEHRARFGIEGYGSFGLYKATRPLYCGTHAKATARRMNAPGPRPMFGSGSYVVVELLDREGRKLA